MIEGFDISHNNDQFNWSTISPSFQFVFMKASQGVGFHDPMFQINWKSARDKGIDWTLPNVLPPVLDVEDQVPASLNINITKDKDVFIKLITDWITIIEAKTNRKVIIYSYKNFFNEYLKDHSWSNNPLWLASYQVAPPSLPQGYSSWIFWQDSQFGQLNGKTTGGGFDLDYFNGTVDQLKAL